MKGLLLKEWYLTKLYIKPMLFLSVVFLITGLIGQEGNLNVVIMIPIIFSIQIMNSFSHDAQSDFDLYAMTVPISKRIYILSKYVYTFGLITAAVLLEGIYLLLFCSIHGGFPTVISFSIGLFSYISLLISFFIIPVLIRFGTEKARLLLAIVFLLVTILGGGLTGMVRYELWTIPAGTLAMMIGLAMMGVLLATGITSYKLSMKWFKLQ